MTECVEIKLPRAEKVNNIVKPPYSNKEALLVFSSLALSSLLCVLLIFSYTSSKAFNDESAFTELPQLNKPENVEQVKGLAANYVTSVEDTKQLNFKQEKIIKWISKRYNVSEDALRPIIEHMWKTGLEKRIDPRLLVAIAAIESRFNPFAQSSVGAQGLMQVMTKVHRDKYAKFGGDHNAFHPLVNVEVGVSILYDCARKKYSIEEGLICYVGGPKNSGYVTKVLNVYQKLINLSEYPATEMFVPLKVDVLLAQN